MPSINNPWITMFPADKRHCPMALNTYTAQFCLGLVERRYIIHWSYIIRDMKRWSTAYSALSKTLQNMSQ